jgi:hypothetical protein
MRALLGGNIMDGLKNQRSNRLRNLKNVGLKFLRFNWLKNIILKPRLARDKDNKSLTKDREEVKVKIRKLVREKEEIESQIVQLQKLGEEKDGEISESPWLEKKRAEKTSKLDELKEKGEEEVYKIGIETEVIEAKADNKKVVAENDEIMGFNDGASKKLEEIIFQEMEEGIDETKIEKKIETKTIEVKADNKKVITKSNESLNFNSASKKTEEVIIPKMEEKTKASDFMLEENREDRMPEKSKTESEKIVQGIFGGSLIEELLKSEDLLYLEEEQNFMKYIGESSATGLVKDLREVKELLASAET